ncbi:HAD family hydrolase [Ferrimonas sp. YFM]|uniref:HAD family hydrolase n=1 Tax=Ferrimonas sp. YFM TaxID=3028878 RepID=UPI002573CA98|nr:HAD family hydrolase [Ferrimonas sp. YFM]BDY04588.1 hypothetical protein F0521_16290 [Ferrimonas sp. YFM]
MGETKVLVNDGEQKSETVPFLVPPDELVDSLRACPEGTPLFIDVDDTLWLSNSTEQFIASVQPSLLVALFLQLMDLLQPWRWFSGAEHRHYRDLYRVKALLMLFPWSRKMWASRVRQLGPEYLNHKLMAPLQRHKGPIYLVSYGFDFILKPLLDAAKVPWPLLVSSTLHNAVYFRQQGKAQWVRQSLGEEAFEGAWSVTDSMLDRDLLEASTRGLLCRWPDSRPVRAGIDPMLPFVYTKKVKRPTESYFTRAVIGHDYLTMVLVFGLSSPEPLLACASLFLFLLSYFSAYEIGYAENDRLGLLYEAKPKVSEAFLRLGSAFRPWFAWMSAMILALPAAWLAKELSWVPQVSGLQGMEAALAVWASFMVLLLGVRATFYWFNRIRERGRSVPMLLLQLARTAGYFVVFSSSLVGALFCFTHGLSKWIPYVTYRFGGERKGMPLHLFNGLMLFLVLAICWAAGAVTWAQLSQWHTLVILLYVVARAAKDVWGFRQAMAPLKPAGREASGVLSSGIKEDERA